MSESIAVIGMACRVPGAASVSEFWQLLLNGTDAITDPPPSRPGRQWRARGGHLDDIHRFDADFFGISPREAVAMDPQQRLLLENVWDALADAGQAPHLLAGSRTGVFVGTSDSHYWDLQVQHGVADIYGVTGGGARSTTSGRISYALDLRGPSMSIDTACSSSLVAVALACQSLAAGECTAALAAGVHLVLMPAESDAFTDAGMLSPQSRCKFGDGSANGFVRGEAVATVVLKPLSQALTDGDPVRAVIRGWATGSDGAASGSLMAPAMEGQRAVLRSAHRRSGIETADIDYVEAHGTGTPVGDAVELEALAEVLGVDRRGGRPLPIGSVKTNIGHAEAAAGLVGLIKTVLVLQHRVIPASLHVSTPHPALDGQAAGLRLPRTAEPLDVTDRPAHAGVSAFGISGTNAHVVLAQPPPAEQHPPPEPQGGDEHLLLLSARTPNALADLVRGYLGYLGPGGAGREYTLANICHTAGVRRTPHEYRVAVVGHDHESMAAALRATLPAVRPPRPARPCRLAFVFPGQGSQWIGMGRELLRTSPEFRCALHRCDVAIRAELGWSVLDVLESATETGQDLTRANVIQPTIWAMQVALATTLRSWGLHPDVVVGHSMGEAAAAFVAGALTLRDSAAVICRRSRLVTRDAAGQGGMAVAELPVADVEELISRFEGRLSVAAENGPTNTVVAGEVDALTAFVADLDERDVLGRLVRVDFASHSAQMDPLLDGLARALSDLAPTAPAVAMRSTVTGELLVGAELDADYWARNLRAPVRFAPTIAQLAAEAPTAFIEISPHPLLSAAITDTVGPDCPVTGSLWRDRPEREALLTALGELWVAGVPIDRATSLFPGRCVALPGYPWQRESFWFDADDNGTGATVREFVLDPARDRYLLDHVVDDLPLVVGPVLLEAARWAAADLLDAAGPLALIDIRFTEALVADPRRPLVLRVELTPTGDRRAEFTICSSDDAGGWTQHCTGTAVRSTTSEPARPASGRGRCSERWTPDRFYEFAAAGGLRTGPAMRALTDLWRGEDELLATIRRPVSLSGASGAPVHPALVEACAVPLVAALAGPGALLATGLDRMVVHRPVSGDLPALHSHIRLTGRDGDLLLADVVVTDGARTPVLEMRGLRLHHRPPSRSTQRNVPGGDPLGCVVQQIAEVLRMAPARVDPHRPLVDLGLDSLMALDIRKRLRSRLGLAVPTKKILSGITAADLAQLSGDDNGLHPVG